MQYTGNIIRPPSEADSIILQVTVGCSHNKCTFCGAYKDKPFGIKSLATVAEDLEFAAVHCRNMNRLFLADGDVLILPQAKLLYLLEQIRKQLPWIRRVSLYGNAKAVRHKSEEELVELKNNGLDRIYLGLESGADDVLDRIKKGETSLSMIDAANKVRQAEIFLSVTALLGLGGVSKSDLHAEQTGKVLRQMAPNQIAVLTLIPLENSPLGQEIINGTFELPDEYQILQELQTILLQLNNVRCQFHANHASTYLPLAGRLPKHREQMLAMIEMALAGDIPTVPDHRRAL